MARIRLAAWYDGHAPGDVIDVADDLVNPLRRDGRVAEVLPVVEQETVTQVVEAVPSEPEPAKRRRRAEE